MGCRLVLSGQTLGFIFISLLALFLAEAREFHTVVLADLVVVLFPVGAAFSGGVRKLRHSIVRPEGWLQCV